MRDIDSSIRATAVPRASLVTPLWLKIASSLRLVFDREKSRRDRGRSRGRWNRQISRADIIHRSVFGFKSVAVECRRPAPRIQVARICALSFARRTRARIATLVFSGQINKSRPQRVADLARAERKTRLSRAPTMTTRSTRLTNDRELFSRTEIDHESVPL